jgi:hypothetical protein
MMARNATVPLTGRIQKRKTNHLRIITFGLQRAAGPYRWANNKSRRQLLDHLVGAAEQCRPDGEAERFGGLEIDYQIHLCRKLYWQISGHGTL